MDADQRLKGIAELVKTIVGLLPLAVVLGGIGLGISWLLSRHMALGTWILAGFLVAHGLVHVMFVTPSPATAPGATEWPFDMTRSWLVTGVGLDLNLVRMVGIALVGVVVLGFVLAGLSTAAILVPSSWWQALVVVSAAASVFLLALFFSPQLVLGVAIDAVLLWVALGSIWTPAAATA